MPIGAVVVAALSFGLLIGSFLNVLIFRYNTGRGFGGRSACGSCNRLLRWFELVPVLSFLIQRARCRRCKAVLSWQYPLVELVTSLVTAGIVAVYGFTWVTLLYLLVAWLLIAITVYDMRHFIIPDVWTLAIVVLGIVGQVTGILPAIASSGEWLDWVAGPLFALPFFILWLASKGRLMGLGDPKLMVALGLVLGFSAGLSALVAAFWIGALVSVGLLLLTRHRKRKQRLTLASEVPFGPFLALGAVLQILLPVPMLSLFF